MTSPFPASSSAAGDGNIVVKLLPGGGSGLEALTYQYPLKLISPSPSADQKSTLVFLLSYGGGLVGGDQVDLSIAVHEGARLSLVTQGHTKIFKSASPDIVTRQTLRVQVEDDAALCLLPDPVQPFEKSVYAQTQIFRLAPRASLCFLDWVTQGRSARGEDWSFVRWSGRNELWLRGSDDAAKDRLLVRDTVVLSGPDSLVLGRPLKETMHKLGIFGTLILRGDAMKPVGDFFLSEFAVLPRIGARDFRSPEDRARERESQSELEKWRAERIEKEIEEGVLWSAAHVRGCVIVKFGARTVEASREWVGGMLFREGTVPAHFGDQALMCLR
jgi:urease accessory protein